MRSVHLHPLFTFLMLLAAVSAFVIPSKYTDKAVPQVQALFWPVARPTRALAVALEGRSAPEPLNVRTARMLRDRNEQLASENIKLRHDLEELARKNDEREKLGDLRPLCTPVPVVGGDAGVRESLAVAGSSLEGFKDGMCVLYPGPTGVQIVGTLQRSGLAGGQVQLITNPGFRVTGFFTGPRKVQIKPDPADPQARPRTEVRYVRLNKEPVLVQGAGRGMMTCTLTRELKDKMGLQPGDWMVLEDHEWPHRLQALRIGNVTEIRPAAPLFVEVRIAPGADLLKLREVMVYMKN